MGLFSSGKTGYANFLGVDIGGSSIKMVELANNNGRAQLVTYGYLERSLSPGKIKLIDEPDKTAELIKRVAEKSKVVTKRAITALPAPAVFNAIISLPGKFYGKIYLLRRRSRPQWSGKPRRFCLCLSKK